MSEGDGSSPNTRARIVDAAAQLMREDGQAAVTTRAVAEKAGVQPPAIYRLFGDKDGLLDAVAEHVMSAYVAAKAAAVRAADEEDVDPLDDLQAGWDTQISFGLENPGVFRLLSDPERVRGSAATREGRDVLRGRVRRLAAAGRLKVSEQRAMDLIQAAGIGTIQSLLATPVEDRDPALPDAMFKAVLSQLLAHPRNAGEHPNANTLTTAVAFRAVAHDLDALSAAERQLVIEWLDRAIAAHGF